MAKEIHVVEHIIQILSMADAEISRAQEYVTPGHNGDKHQ